MKKILLAILSLSFVVSFSCLSVEASSLEENFIQALYEVKHDQAIEYDEALSDEVKEALSKVDENSDESSTKLISFDSEYIETNIVEPLAELVDEDYLEKLVANGFATQKYTTALENESDFSIEELTLVSEDDEEDTLKQVWQFTLIETSTTDKDDKEQWQIEVKLEQAKETETITYFKEISREQAE